MIIDKTTSSPSQAPLPGVNQAIPQSAAIVKVGAILDVLVFAKLGNNQYEVRANNQRLLASSEQPLQPGTRQQLQITGIRPDGSIIASALPHIPTPARELSAMILQRLGSAAMPQNLVQLVQQLGQQPGALASLYAQLVAIFPKRQERMDASVVRKWITQLSGLATGSTPRLKPSATASSQPDYKSLLLALLSGAAKASPDGAAKLSWPSGYSALPEELTELFRLGSSTGTSTPAGSVYQSLQAALSRLESQQLFYLQAKHEGFFQLLFDIPVLGQDRDHVWQGFIQRESDPKHTAQDNSAEERWTASLSTELEGLGIIAIRLEYSESATEIAFYSTKGPVCEQISSLLDAFSQRLQQLGLPSPRLSVCHGRLPESCQPRLDIGHLEIIA